MAGTELEARARARLGSVIRGKYQLDRVLGVGGMAAVYAATHRNQKQFALKILHPELSLREDVRQRFLREGYAANSVKHAGAVAVIDEDTAEDGSAFLVMELLDGATVAEIGHALGNKWPLEQALVMGEQLLDVLAAAHARGIVHRDVKPANVFVTREGQVKVLDFGIARVRDAAAGNVSTTGTGFLLGTPAFMSPEQAYGRTRLVDAQTDVWAAGATLFTVISGEFVHNGESASEVVIKAATTAARSLAVVAPSTPPVVVAAVDRALALDKTERWASAESMRDALRRALIVVFGRATSRETLEEIWQSLPPRAASTVPPAPHASSPRLVMHAAPAPYRPPTPTASGPFFQPSPSTPAPLPAPSGPLFPATPVPYLPPAVSSSPVLAQPLVGATTARPVLIGRSASAGRVAIVATASILLLLGAAAVFAILRGRASLATPDVSAPAASRSATAVVALPAPPQPVAATAPAAANLTASATSAPATAPSSVPDEPSPTAPASTAGQPPARVPVVAAKVLPAPAAAPPPAASTAASKIPPASCSPPYYYDLMHRKIFKPECVN